MMRFNWFARRQDDKLERIARSLEAIEAAMLSAVSADFLGEASEGGEGGEGEDALSSEEEIEDNDGECSGGPHGLSVPRQMVQSLAWSN